MRLKRVGRLGTTGALVAAAFGASIVFTPSSASAASDWKCHGTAVKRCATVWWDETADTYRARAKITDAAGGGTYKVAVSNVKLQRTSGADLITVRTARDDDGWHDTEDLAGTTTIDPCTWPRESFRVVATFSWKGTGSGKETWRPNNSWGHLCD
ncbi:MULTISPECIES: hypothetical protein [unclassified Streptomyces]|uniref:hypothetical protein n=1 Tax=unclassified Streptomyces TaxID=2593676 RepID=UPI002DD89C8D|nr:MULTISPECIES: hypothetical protein [unclassified Streptomyces]WSA90206.1 hypothetical protein OIE63_00655 [Streptomyces sp. NBC_01795]WSB74433.1 hypothetical protein OHB04_00650 [Streptomyces sp. NBC_01775]WSS17184.1 hypothetical protein OG533_38745 [Streptomyces sp. NBC_01186]WSS45930.1 hypothetical protein OG220_39005 [Streptomyces sp. NBC_01187]